MLVLYWLSFFVSYALMNRQGMPPDQVANSDRLLITMVGFTGLALMAAEGLRTMSDVLRVVRTLVAGISVMCVVAILQSRAGLDLSTWPEKIPILTTSAEFSGVYARSGFNRPAGTALHPIEFGVVVGVGLALALHVLLYDRVWTARWRWATFGLIALGIPLSISRSALLVAVIVLIMFFVGAPTHLRVKLWAGLGCFLAVIFVTVPGLLGTLKGFVFAGESDSSISTRTDDYGAVSSYLRHSPWLGRGPGSFLPSIRVLDNQYLLTLIESGIVGFLCLLAVLSLPAWLGRGGRRRSDGEAHRNLGQVLAGTGVGVTAAAATYDAFSFPTFTAVVAIVIGISGAYWRLSREGDVLPSAPPGPAPHELQSAS